MFAFDRVDVASSHRTKIEEKLHGDVDYLTGTHVWTQYEKKVKLSQILFQNTADYVRELGQLFRKQKGSKLEDFLEEQLKANSTSGHWMKPRVAFVADSADFVARRVQTLGNDGWKKNQGKINRVFVSCFDGQLAGVKRQFEAMNYGDDKTMAEWVQKKCSDKPHAQFLSKMLQHCHERGVSK